MPISTQQLINLPNLRRGSSGADVRILQQWLVENGFLTQAQMNTGPGIYGPQTKAAVAAWQSSKGIDTQGNPGYFGPLSKAYLSKALTPTPAPTPTPTPKVAPAPTPTPTPTPAPTPPSGVDVTKPVPDAVAFKSTDAYKALPADMKEFVDIAYNLIEVGGEAEAKMFANAISQAQATAGPYYSTQLSLAKAEVLGSIAEKNQDFESKRSAIQTARDELMADVSRNKDFLSLDQQAEIARTVKGYDEDLLTIADEAAEKGLTFATGARSRALAESRRGEQFQDVIQSGQRRFNFQIKELELKAARGDVDAQKQLADLQAKQSFGLQQIGRAAEEVLGSTNVPAIPGFTPTGGALGKIEEEKRRTTISDVGGFLQLQKGFI